MDYNLKKFIRTVPRQLRINMGTKLFRIVNDTCHADIIDPSRDTHCMIINEEIESIRSGEKTVESLNLPEESTKEKVFPFDNFQYLAYKLDILEFNTIMKHTRNYLNKQCH